MTIIQGADPDPSSSLRRTEKTPADGAQGLRKGTILTAAFPVRDLCGGLTLVRDAFPLLGGQDLEDPLPLHPQPSPGSK